MMKRLWLNALVVVLAPLTAAPVCSNEEVPIGEDDVGTSSGDGGWGYCSSLGSAWSCPGNSVFGSEDIETCDSDCSCVLPCSSDSDCPAPETGTAVRKCGHLGTADSDRACVLPCGDGESCPDGMSCQADMSPNGPICVWHEDGELNLRCDPDSCARYTTQDACEAAHEGFPVEHDLVCVWATESILPGSSDACEVIATEKKCVAAQREPNNPILCDAAAPCGEEPRVVYWRDLGGGDIALLAIDGCEHYPYSQTYNYEVCAFGDPTLPLKCDCACEEE